MSEPVPRTPRRDTTAADATSLERMACLPKLPTPQWSGLFLEPDLPPVEDADLR